MSFDFKSASKSELKAIYNQMAEELGSFKLLSKKELYYLPKLLSDREQVLSYTTGYMDTNSWVIALTDRRIIFLDVGFFYGVKSTTINLEMINAVSGESGLAMGKISIAHGGGVWVIDNVWKSSVTPFTNKIRDAMELRRNALVSNTSVSSQSNFPPLVQAELAPVSTEDTFTKLNKLSQMLAAGDISRKEFEELKVRALRGQI